MTKEELEQMERTAEFKRILRKLNPQQLEAIELCMRQMLEAENQLETGKNNDKPNERTD
jgi:hypothetical protein